MGQVRYVWCKTYEGFREGSAVSSSMQSKREFLSPWPETHVQSHDPRACGKILTAFNGACDQDDLEVASLLLIEYERVVTRYPVKLDGNRRSEIDTLISAHARLWQLLRISVDE
jgi:hypothetical protein